MSKGKMWTKMRAWQIPIFGVALFAVIVFLVMLGALRPQKDVQATGSEMSLGDGWVMTIAVQDGLNTLKRYENLRTHEVCFVALPGTRKSWTGISCFERHGE